MVTHAIIDRLFTTFGIPEALDSDQDTDFDDDVVYRRLQETLGFEKNHITQYRPQGNSVSERVHITMHARLAIYCSIKQDNNWATILSFIQLAYTTPFSTTIHDKPYFLEFGRQACFTCRHNTTTSPGGILDRHTRNNQRNTGEPTNFTMKSHVKIQENAQNRRQENSKTLKPYPAFKPGEKVPLHMVTRIVHILNFCYHGGNHTRCIHNYHRSYTERDTSMKQARHRYSQATLPPTRKTSSPGIRHTSQILPGKTDSQP